MSEGNRSSKELLTSIRQMVDSYDSMCIDVIDKRNLGVKQWRALLELAERGLSHEPTTRQPDGWAFRHETPDGGSIVSFDQFWNGQRPIEQIPYYFGEPGPSQPPTVELVGALRAARAYVEAYTPRDVSEAHSRDLLMHSIDVLAPSTKEPPRTYSAEPAYSGHTEIFIPEPGAQSEEIEYSTPAPLASEPGAAQPVGFVARHSDGSVIREFAKPGECYELHNGYSWMPVYERSN